MHRPIPTAPNALHAVNGNTPMKPHMQVMRLCVSHTRTLSNKHHTLMMKHKHQHYSPTADYDEHANMGADHASEHETTVVTEYVLHGVYPQHITSIASRLCT